VHLSIDLIFIFIYHLGFQNPNVQAQDQSWQNRPNTQLTGNQLSQSASFNTQNTQNFVPQPQSWQGRFFFLKSIPLFFFRFKIGSQSFQNQQWPSTLNSQSSTDLKNGQLQSKYLLFEKLYHLIALFQIEGIQPQIRQDNQQQQSMYL
jgi:hypothetical protein